MIKRFIFVFVALFIVGLMFGCAAPNKIDAADISNITIIKLETDEVKSIDKDQFTEFADGYNHSARHRDDVGTTHPLRADVLFIDGSTVVVWGGVGSFISVQKDDTEFNIKSEELGAWFDQYK